MKKPSAVRSATATRWQYKVVRPLSTSGLAEDDWAVQAEKQLGDLGAEGWELVTHLDQGTLVFKRSK